MDVRRHLAALAAAAALATPVSSRAAGEQAASLPSSRSGPSFGLRSGWAVPIGNLYTRTFTPIVFGPGGGGSSSGGGDVSLGSVFNGVVPLWADLGWRTRRVFVGGFFQYGLGVTSSAFCKDPSTGATGDCTSHDYRIGVDVHYHVAPDADLDPWLGLGVGYEWMTFHGTLEGVTKDESLDGIELFDVQAGVDKRLDRGLGVGLYTMISLAQYTGFHLEDSSSVGGPQDGRVKSLGTPSPHAWFTIGLRATYDL